MDWIWVVILTALIFFSSFASYRIGHLRGYGVGVKKILGEWKKYMNMEEYDNE